MSDQEAMKQEETEKEDRNYWKIYNDVKVPKCKVCPNHADAETVKQLDGRRPGYNMPYDELKKAELERSERWSEFNSAQPNRRVVSRTTDPEQIYNYAKWVLEVWDKVKDVDPKPLIDFLHKTEFEMYTRAQQIINVALQAAHSSTANAIQMMEKMDNEASGILDRDYSSLAEFCTEFNKLQAQGHQMKRVWVPKKLRTGFEISQLKERHLISMSVLSYFYKPLSIKEWMQEEMEDKLSRATPEEKQTDELVEAFVTTGISHDLGRDWIGRVEMFLSPLPTVLGGPLHPIKSDYRYRIEWFNPRSRNRIPELLTAMDMRDALKSRKICVMDEEDVDKPPKMLRRQAYLKTLFDDPK
jgi:hypothetical protein